MSLLRSIAQADSFPYEHERVQYSVTEKDYYKFCSHTGIVLGLVIPRVAVALEKYTETVQVDHVTREITICKALRTVDERTLAFQKITHEWRQLDCFGLSKSWRNEQFIVYNPSHTCYMLLERAATPLFGVVTYGVHILGYTGDLSVPETVKLWVPRRSYTKATFPGLLDNTVAGGLGHPYGILETAIKECREEAGLSREYLQDRLSPSGMISCIYRSGDSLEDERGFVQPEVEYVYDLKMDDQTVPHPEDGEVHEFTLMSLHETLEELKALSFKPNAAMVTIDFLIRHGIIDPESESDYLEIVSRSHRRLPYPLR